jgi:two-component system, LytTR family, sensor kinase
MRYDRNFVIDVLLGFAITALAAIVLIALAAEGIVTRWLPIAGIAGLVAIALGLLVTQLATRPDHLRAMQSDMILTVANETLAYFRQGLSQESAEEVCRIVLAHTEVAAVAITDTKNVLGFVGVGEDHHAVGEAILTRATHEVVETGEHRILHNRFEIGCPELECRLNAAIVVPLEMRGAPVGTLKFYYTSPRQLNETQIAMAEGLAQLLSTQLELSELERQVELATRMELRALQAQINPHFLFNTINTIASLVRTDPTRARDLLRQFAAFYRRTLESAKDMVPLERELEYARMYVSFEGARFGDRLEFHEEVDDDLFDLEVPAFVIQPLVENAVQHGMRHDAPLQVSIISEARPDCTVVLSVVDDGLGIAPEDLGRVLEPGFGKGLGIALKNVDDRIRGHFGPGSGVNVESTPGSGTTVSLVLVDALDALAGEC